MSLEPFDSLGESTCEAFALIFCEKSYNPYLDVTEDRKIRSLYRHNSIFMYITPKPIGGPYLDVTEDRDIQSLYVYTKFLCIQITKNWWTYLDVAEDVVQGPLHHLLRPRRGVLGMEPEGGIAEVQVAQDIRIPARQGLGELDLAAQSQGHVGADGEVGRQAAELRLVVALQVGLGTAAGEEGEEGAAAGRRGRGGEREVWAIRLEGWSCV